MNTFQLYGMTVDDDDDDTQSEAVLSLLQALSPLKTLDELNVCETPTWPCFPTQEQRRSFTPASESCKDKGESLSGSEDMDVNAGAKRKLRCFVVTARARSFLYHQVRT